MGQQCPFFYLKLIKMIVEADKKYIVRWKHNSTDVPVTITHTILQPRSSQCYIQKLNSEGTVDYFVSQGFSVCSKADNFNKSKGRIVSLTKAIKHLPKDVRKQFFQQYANEIGFK